MKPKVTVMMPVYNAARYLSQSIESVLRQDYPSFELIIFDDGSTDRSYEIAKRYRADRRVRLFASQRNRGVACARNRILHLARGEYIATHDADDIMLAGRLKKQALILDRHPEVGVVFGMALTITGTGKALEWYYWPWVQGRNRNVRLTKSQKLKKYPQNIPHGSVMIRRSAILQAGGYKRELKVGEDTDLLMKLWGRTGFYFMTHPVYLLRLHPDSLTARDVRYREQCVTRRKERFRGKNVRASFHLHQWEIVIATESKHYLSVLKSYLPRYFDSPNGGTRSGRSRITFCVQTRTGREDGIDLEMDGSCLYQLRKDGLGSMVDFEENTIFIFMDPSKHLSESLIYHGGFLFPLFLLQRKFKEVLVHASLVARGRSGVLIMGRDGAGKSTLAVSFIGHGYRYFSDEHPILTLGRKGVEGRSFVNRLGLPPVSAWNFSDLAGEFEWNPKMKKFYLDPEKIAPDYLDETCRIEKVIFPEFIRKGRGGVRQLNLADFWNRAAQDDYFQCRFGHPQEEQPLDRVHRLLFEKLVKTARGFLVRYRPSGIRVLPEIIEKL